MNKTTKVEILFLKKKTKNIRKKLSSNLLESIQVMQKKCYDTDYEVSKIQIIISKLKKIKNKEKTK